MALRVAVDASSATSGGGTTYLCQLLPRLAAVPRIEIVALLLRKRGRAAAGIEDMDLPVMSGGRLAAAGAEWQGAVDESKADVVFAPTEISFSSYRRPLVLAVRNAALGPGNMREYPAHLRGRVALQRQLARRSARHAASHIAVSQYAAGIASAALRVPAERVHVVYHGGPPVEHSPRFGRARRFLFVSNLYRYKNLHRLLIALSTVERPWTLDVVGEPLEQRYSSALAALVRDLRLCSRVRFVGHLAGSRLTAAYDSADCFVWPAYTETFGHPLLEAHSRGLPIIAARAASNVEIAGEAAHYFDPFNVEELRTLVVRAMESGLHVGRLPRQYSWDACAEQTSVVLRQAVDGRNDLQAGQARQH